MSGRTAGLGAVTCATVGGVAARIDAALVAGTGVGIDVQCRRTTTMSSCGAGRGALAGGESLRGGIASDAVSSSAAAVKAIPATIPNAAAELSPAVRRRAEVAA